MSFDGLQGLKQSALFQSSHDLQTMSEGQLEKFLWAYNSVFARVLRNGGSEDGATKGALRIALSVAKEVPSNSGVVGRMRAFFSPSASESMVAGEDWAVDRALQGLISPASLTTWAASYVEDPEGTDSLLPPHPVCDPMADDLYEMLSAQDMDDIKQAVRESLGK